MMEQKQLSNNSTNDSVETHLSELHQSLKSDS